jgi:DNA-binding GntR family transcriptional regulator
MTAHSPRLPRYRQVAAAIRNQVTAGQLHPGDELPAEAALADQHHVSASVISAAMRALRDEGLVVTVPGRRSRIRPALPRTVIPLHRGDRITFRMPDPFERQELDIPTGTPIAVVTRTHDGSVERHACDRTAFRTPEDPPPDDPPPDDPRPDDSPPEGGAPGD